RAEHQRVVVEESQRARGPFSLVEEVDGRSVEGLPCHFLLLVLDGASQRVAVESSEDQNRARLLGVAPAGDEDVIHGALGVEAGLRLECTEWLRSRGGALCRILAIESALREALDIKAHHEARLRH